MNFSYDLLKHLLALTLAFSLMVGAAELAWSEEKYPFEVKIWRGQKRFKIGLNQIKYYIKYENVQYGFYIIFDPRKRGYRSDIETLKYNSHEIYQIFIHINPKSPQETI